MNETLRPFYDIFAGNVQEIPLPIGTGSFVDVRDVAFMHVWAYENPSTADGHRYIACEGLGPPQAVADILRKKYEGTEIGRKIFTGNPGSGYLGYNKDSGNVDYIKYLPGRPRVSGQYAAEVMGFKYFTYPESVIDTAKALETLV